MTTYGFIFLVQQLQKMNSREEGFNNFLWNRRNMKFGGAF